MCGGVEYQGHRVYFPQQDARIPVRLRGGLVSWEIWGKREPGPMYDFPQGGWARLDSIQAGKWKRWQPQPVKILADRFMEKDDERQSHWIDVAPGMAIQGLVAHSGKEHRIYVVTVDTPAEFSWVHDRWPRLVKVSNQSPEY